MREQFDMGVDCQDDWVPGKPDYLRLWGDAQVRYSPTKSARLRLTSAFDMSMWPSESQFPGFKSLVTEYFNRLGGLSSSSSRRWWRKHLISHQTPSLACKSLNANHSSL